MKIFKIITSLLPSLFIILNFILIDYNSPLSTENFIPYFSLILFYLFITLLVLYNSFLKVKFYIKEPTSSYFHSLFQNNLSSEYLRFKTLNKLTTKNNIAKYKIKSLKDELEKEEIVEKWKNLKVKLVEHSNLFLEKNYNMKLEHEIVPFYEGDSMLGYCAGNRDLITNNFYSFEIAINFYLILFAIKEDKIDCLLPVLHHELVHYVLMRQNKEYKDGEKEFEDELLKLNISSNYSLINSKANYFFYTVKKRLNGIEVSLHERIGN